MREREIALDRGLNFSKSMVGHGSRSRPCAGRAGGIQIPRPSAGPRTVGRVDCAVRRPAHRRDGPGVCPRRSPRTSSAWSCRPLRPLPSTPRELVSPSSRARRRTDGAGVDRTVAACRLDGGGGCGLGSSRPSLVLRPQRSPTALRTSGAGSAIVSAGCVVRSLEPGSGSGGLGGAEARPAPSSAASDGSIIMLCAPWDDRCHPPTRRSAFTDAAERRGHVHRRLVGLERDQRVLRGSPCHPRRRGSRSPVPRRSLRYRGPATWPDDVVLIRSSASGRRGRSRTSRSPRRRRSRSIVPVIGKFAQSGDRHVPAVDLEEAPQGGARSRCARSRRYPSVRYRAGPPPVTHWRT